ncbi:MAG: hypothetical protein GXO89_16905 [Chlorobi bacterium]|nr:hypothetical protein [Chlorobiota bacterium]
MKLQKNHILILILLFAFFASLSLYRHKNIGPNSFRTEIWADRAGYYVYLPSTFIYNFSTENFPENIEPKTGEGFFLNKERKRIETKYTYGVALMQLPFFLVADAITVLSHDYPRDGFSYYYQKSINFAAAFYLALGLYLLFLALKVYFGYKNKLLIATIATFFFGTNLYYYGIIETGMSHIYSFFLFSSLLFLVTHKAKFKNKLRYFSFLGLISGLIVLIRPTNIIILTIPFIWGVGNFKQLSQRFKEFFKPSIIPFWLVPGLLVLVPQFVYWKYSTGHFLSYTYKDEGFSNALSPNVFEVLFAPNNGLFPYSLTFILALVGIVLIWKSNKTLALYSSFVFLLITYMTASWHDWRFGCGAGMRNMVEYYALFSFPMAFSVHKLFSMKKGIIKFLIFATLGFFVMISFKVNYHYFGCYFSGIWDWSDYVKYLFYPVQIN